MSGLDVSGLPVPSIATRTADASRLARFLRHVDERLTQEVACVVYGSCAVSLYLGHRDEQAYLAMTDDIDLSAPVSDELLMLLQRASPDERPSLEFRVAVSVENWLIHPDWRDRLFDASPQLGLHRLHLSLLHPVDLILTKLERWNDRDFQDALELVEHLGLTQELLSVSLDEALEYYVGDPEYRGLRDNLLDLFDE